jgi:hypothetical protein
MFSMLSSPIRPDLSPFAFDRADSASRWGFWQRSRQFLDGRGLDHRAVDQPSARLGPSYLCEPCEMGRHGLFLKTGTQPPRHLPGRRPQVNRFSPASHAERLAG